MGAKAQLVLAAEPRRARVLKAIVALVVPLLLTGTACVLLRTTNPLLGAPLIALAGMIRPRRQSSRTTSLRVSPGEVREPSSLGLRIVAENVQGARISPFHGRVALTLMLKGELAPQTIVVDDSDALRKTLHALPAPRANGDLHWPQSHNPREIVASIVAFLTTIPAVAYMWTLLRGGAIVPSGLDLVLFALPYPALFCVLLARIIPGRERTGLLLSSAGVSTLCPPQRAHERARSGQYPFERTAYVEHRIGTRELYFVSDVGERVLVDADSPAQAAIVTAHVAAAVAARRGHADPWAAIVAQRPALAQRPGEPVADWFRRVDAAPAGTGDDYRAPALQPRELLQVVDSPAQPVEVRAAAGRLLLRVAGPEAHPRIEASLARGTLTEERGSDALSDDANLAAAAVDVMTNSRSN
jgi:hypothetical protein